MRSRRAAVLASLLLLSIGLSGARAQAPAEPEYKPPTEKDPVSGVVVRGLMWRLQQTMADHPVIAVGYGYFRPDLTWSEDDYKHAPSDIEKLQIIAAKTSAPDHAMIPFRVRDAYVIAPETRDGLNTDLSKLTPFDVTGRGLLLADALTRLTAEQVKALGSNDGLAVSSLPADMRRSVARAFRPPLPILVYTRRVKFNDDGLPDAEWSRKRKGELDQPLDLSTLRLRARLRMGGAMARIDRAFGFLNGGPGGQPTFAPSQAARTPYMDRGMDLPLFPDVPNTFKPSDLAGDAWRQPVGISGIWNVKQVVAQLSKVTGLKLSAWEPYRDQPVFLGAKSLTAGEVMDGLRLALTASWRKMGDAYYLVWDRMPLAAIDLSARETANAAIKTVKEMRDGLDARPGMWTLLTTLPFSEDDPLALADDQRATLFKMHGADAGEADAELPFGDLTTEQQDFLRRTAAETTLETFSDEGRQESASRTMTPQDLQAVQVSPVGQIEVSASVPGQGWVRLGLDEDGLGFAGPRPPLGKAADKERDKREFLEDMPAEFRERLKSPKPVTPPSATRGLVTPALGASRLATLADEMKRHGLNVLFYPALIGGYATFPTDQFPLHPALRGVDGLAAAGAAMKPKGIRVVAYLNTLAWQDDGDTDHWLNKYPDWLDVDALGRGRLAWLNDHPDVEGDDSFGAERDKHNYVRASEPRVEARLKALLTELAARKDIPAVALAATRPVSYAPFMPGANAVPELGYAWPDRLAAFRKSGADPADNMGFTAYVPDSLINLGVGNGQDEDVAPDAHTALTARLLRFAKAARKDWRVYLVNDTALPDDAPPASAADTPKPDAAITNLFLDAGSGGILIPIRYKTAADLLRANNPGPDSELLDEIYGDFPLIPLVAEGIAGDSSGRAIRPPIILFDFRGAPQIITDSLKWIAAPALQAPPAQHRKESKTP